MSGVCVRFVGGSGLWLVCSLSLSVVKHSDEEAACRRVLMSWRDWSAGVRSFTWSWARVGDFRRGSLNEVRRKCGKPNCACAAPGHPGHGPQWNLTRTADGRTRAVHLKPGPELEKARREVAEYERFRDLVGQVMEVNEAICAGPPGGPGRGRRGCPFRAGRGKGGLRDALAAEKAAELGRLAAEAARVLGCGDAGLEAAEAVIRAGLLRLGGSMLEQLLAADRGYRGPRVPVRPGARGRVRRLPGQVLRHGARPGHPDAGLVSLRGLRARSRPARRRARHGRGRRCRRAWPR